MFVPYSIEDVCGSEWRDVLFKASALFGGIGWGENRNYFLLVGWGPAINIVLDLGMRHKITGSWRSERLWDLPYMGKGCICLTASGNEDGLHSQVAAFIHLCFHSPYPRSFLVVA